MKQATQDILRTACPAMYADIFTVIDDTMFGTKKYWKQQFSKCFATKWCTGSSGTFTSWYYCWSMLLSSTKIFTII